MLIKVITKIQQMVIMIIKPETPLISVIKYHGNQIKGGEYMKKRIYTNNKYLKPFFTEINKYTDGVHSLNSGIDIRYIEETERKLNITLPNIYKDFLQVCNGGEFFIPGTVFSEVYNPTYGEKRNGTPYLDESFKRRLPAMPDSLLIIADLNYGRSEEHTSELQSRFD